MIDWHPIATLPPMVEVDVDRVQRSRPVLVWLKGGSWQRDRICRMLNEPRPFSELYGFDITHWSEVNSPTEGAT